MKLARILLASSAVAVLAACGADPVGPSGSAPAAAARNATSMDPGSVQTVEGSPEEQQPQLNEATGGPNCIVITTTIGGITTTATTCSEAGPHIMGGGG